MPDTREAHLLRNGRNQEVRIPIAFELPADTAPMDRESNRLVIEPVVKSGLVATLDPIERRQPVARARRDSVTTYQATQATGIVSDLIRNPQVPARSSLCA